jgi:helicase
MKIEKILKLMNITKYTPAQYKAIKAGLLDHKSLLICTPTGSGKTLIGLMAAINAKKAIYIDFNNLGLNVGISIGDESADNNLGRFDLIVLTSEKLDSLLRHRIEWIHQVDCLVVDEIHLLNDPSRGPTLEIIITLLKTLKNDLQIVGLSATIGNPQDLADWLEAILVEDDWRPVPLKKGVYLDGEVEFI